MAQYYVFYGSKGELFQKATSLVQALSWARGDEKRVYRRAEGIPNPFWMYGIKDGKVDRSKLYKSVPVRRLARLRPQGLFGFHRHKGRK